MRGSCSSCFCRFRGCAAQNGRLTYEPSVFRSTNEAGIRGKRLADPRTPSRNVFCFCPSRKTKPFFVGRKAAKEHHFRDSRSSCFCRFRGCAAQNGRLTYEPSVFRSTNEAGIRGKRLADPRTPSRNVFCFCPSRKTKPFFVGRKAAKEHHFRDSRSSCFCRFRGCAAQNGRLTYEPSVFRSTNEAGIRGKRLADPRTPSRNVFCFCPSRKEIVSPLLCVRKRPHDL